MAQLNENRLQETLKQIMQEHKQKIYVKLKSALIEKKVIATGKTIESLAVEIEQNTSNALTDIVVSFKNSGRFVDMKNLQPRKNAKARLGRRKSKPWYNKNMYRLVFSEEGLVNDIFEKVTDDMIQSLNEINKR